MTNKSADIEQDAKANYFRTKSTESLEKELSLLLCMDNGGGLLANDIIEELGKRIDAESKNRDLSNQTLHESEPSSFIKTVDAFLLDCNNVKIDQLSYYITYPEFIKYFTDITTITKHHLIIGINFVYGWMPKVFKFHSDKFDEAVVILNQAKKGNILTVTELSILKELFNNSLVGTSKLLHFINPKVFAIWDSHVYRYLMEMEPYNYRVEDCELYLKYLGFCRLVTQRVEFDQAHKSICARVGQQMTKMRTAELVMYLNGKA